MLFFGVNFLDDLEICNGYGFEKSYKLFVLTGIVVVVTIDKKDTFIILRIVTVDDTGNNFFSGAG